MSTLIYKSCVNIKVVEIIGSGFCVYLMDYYLTHVNYTYESVVIFASQRPDKLSLLNLTTQRRGVLRRFCDIRVKKNVCFYFQGQMHNYSRVTVQQ